MPNYRTQRYDREADVVTQTNATDISDVRFVGPRRPGLIGWRIDAISHDKAVKSGSAAILTSTFKAQPQEQSDLMGGDRYHTFARLDTNQQTRIPFGVTLNPGEDLVLKWTNGTAGKSVYVTCEATLLFDEDRIPLEQRR